MTEITYDIPCAEWRKAAKPEGRIIITYDITYDDCVEWLKAAEPGGRIIYHVGSLAFDRKSNHYLDMVASLFLGAAGYRFIPSQGAMRWNVREEPRCILVQRKLMDAGRDGWPVFSYIAIKR